MVAIAIVALPSPAAAAYLVPPENSAATQYTETFPTVGGQGNAEREPRGGGRSPGKVLGERNVQRLEDQGPQGRAVAQLAAETAPNSGAVRDESGGDDSGVTTPSARGGGDGGPIHSSEEIGESSGLSEVLSQATGLSSSGGMGLLLPLIILGAIAWSLSYLLRQRKKQAA